MTTHILRNGHLLRLRLSCPTAGRVAPYERLQTLTSVARSTSVRVGLTKPTFHPAIRSDVNNTKFYTLIRSKGSLSSSTKSNLPPLSKEQTEAITALLTTPNNIIINACAGSGKTLVILSMAHAAPHMNFLVLVYNRSLMLETQERVKKLRLTNITVLNYHSLGARYYTSECATDQGMKRVFQEGMPVKIGETLPKCDVLVMDEQQDMTPILKLFIDKVLKDIATNQPDGERRLVVLGDPRQELYQFNNSNSRFLTMASEKEVFGYVNDKPWTTINLPSSYRVSHQNAQFICQQLLHPDERPIHGIRKNDDRHNPLPHPKYVILDIKNEASDEIKSILDSNLSESKILVTAPSIRGRYPQIFPAINDLAIKGYRISVSNEEGTGYGIDVAAGKMLVASHHQTKGIERDTVFVVGFDVSYEEVFNRLSGKPDCASNPHYVACTRASKQLILLHHHKKDYLPFLDQSTLSKSCDIVERSPLKISKPRKKSKEREKIDVTSLLRSVPDKLLTRCLSMLTLTHVVPGTQPYLVPPPSYIKDVHNLYESVFEISGTAVPAIFEYRLRHSCSTIDSLKRTGKKPKCTELLPPKYHAQLQEVFERYRDQTTTADILFAANWKKSDIEGLLVKMLAIPLNAYTWLTEKHANHIFHTLAKHIPTANRGIGTLKFERQLSLTLPADNVDVQGVVDIITSDGTQLWEVKYTSTFRAEHVLQAAVYAALSKDNPECYLVSALTGQLVKIEWNMEGRAFREQLVRLLVQAKKRVGGQGEKTLENVSNEKFLEECSSNFKEWVAPVAVPRWLSEGPQRRSNKAG